jgi:hypothetical protein
LTCSLCVILIKIGGRGVLHLLLLILTSYLLHWVWPWCKLKVSSGLGVVTPSSTMSSKPSTTLKITSSLRSIILSLALLASSTTALVVWTITCKVAYLTILMTRPRSILVPSTNFHGLAVLQKRYTYPCLDRHIRQIIIRDRDWEVGCIRLSPSQVMSLLRDALIGGCASLILGAWYILSMCPREHGSLSKILLDMIQLPCCKLKICISRRPSPNSKGLNNLWVDHILHEI